MRKKLKLVLFSMTFIFLFNVCVFAKEDYTIKEGDTIYGISKILDVSIDELIALNPELQDPDKIFPGDKVKIPTEEQEYANDSEAEDILKLVNEKRAEQNLQPLKLNSSLTKIAQQKCDDMFNNNYFGHESKKYGHLSEILEDNKIEFISLGENLARNYDSAEKVFNAWMNSDSHSKNILYPSFDETGIYYLKTQQGSFWVQIFVRSK